MRSAVERSVLWVVAACAGCGGAMMPGGEDTAGAGLAGSASVSSTMVTDIAKMEEMLNAKILWKDVADTAKILAQIATSVVDWQPANCATQVTGKSSVTFTYANCTSPLKANGTITAAVLPTLTMPPGIQLTLKTDKDRLVVNNATYSVDASTSLNKEDALTKFEITIPPESKMIPRSPGTSATDNATMAVVSVMGNVSVVTDAATHCVTTNGGFTTTVGAVSYSAMIAALTRCPNKCPAMGGSATLSGGGKSATVSYDGTNKAKYTLGDGTSGTITLPCTL